MPGPRRSRPRTSRRPSPKHKYRRSPASARARPATAHSRAATIRSIAERRDLVAAAGPRRAAPASRPSAVGQSAERIDDDVRLLLAVEPPDIDQQRLVVGEAQAGGAARVAPRRRELADLHPERDHIDIVDALGSKLGGAAVFAEREDRVEARDRALRNRHSRSGRTAAPAVGP